MVWGWDVRRVVFYTDWWSTVPKRNESEKWMWEERKAKKKLFLFLFLQCSISLFFFPPPWTVWCSVKAHLQTDTHDSARCTPPGPRWLHSWVLTVRQPRPQKATITIYSAAATATLEGLYLSRERERGGRKAKRTPADASLRVGGSGRHTVR